MNCVCDVRVQLSVMRGKDIHGISRRMSELNSCVDRMGCCVVRDCCGQWRIFRSEEMVTVEGIHCERYVKGTVISEDSIKDRYEIESH